MYLKYSFETTKDEAFWLSCLFAPPGAALRYVLALWMARSKVCRYIYIYIIFRHVCVWCEYTYDM